MSSTAVRDYFRTPEELVLFDRLLSLGVDECHLGVVTHNSGMQSNHFPHSVSPNALPHLLMALRVHRDDAIVGALGPTVCESLWTWAQWPLPRPSISDTWRARNRRGWPVLGDTLREARELRCALEAFANSHHPRGCEYVWRGCWRELSPKGGEWPWSSLTNVDDWPLLFGASRQGFENMRAYRAGEGR